MYEAKTKPTEQSVADYLAAIENDERRRDCEALVTLMKRLTGCPATMWGTSIVGFDRYRYEYASGHKGESCVVGFSSRKGDLSVYLLGGYEEPATQALLAQLGRHKIGKACLYLRKLADVQLPVLEQLVVRSVAEVRRRYPLTGA
jgi:hypothetical protein